MGVQLEAFRIRRGGAYAAQPRMAVLLEAFRIRRGWAYAAQPRMAVLLEAFRIRRGGVYAAQPRMAVLQEAFRIRRGGVYAAQPRMAVLLEALSDTAWLGLRCTAKNGCATGAEGADCDGESRRLVHRLNHLLNRSGLNRSGQLQDGLLPGFPLLFRLHRSR